MTKASVSVQDQVTKLLEAYQEGRISEEVYQKNLDRLMKAVVEDSAETAVAMPPKIPGPRLPPAESSRVARFEQIPQESRQPLEPALAKARMPVPKEASPREPRPPRQSGAVLGTPSTAVPACRKCGSTDLHICTDGSGTCNSCGKAFPNLTGKPERIKEENPQPKALYYYQEQQYIQPYPPSYQQLLPQYPPPYQQPPPQYYSQQPQYPPPQYQPRAPYVPPQPPPPQYQPPKQYVAYRVPPSNADGISPECQRCGSNNLHICSDGSGSCNYCGKAFADITESAASLEKSRSRP